MHARGKSNLRRDDARRLSDAWWKYVMYILILAKREFIRVDFSSALVIKANFPI